MSEHIGLVTIDPESYLYPVVESALTAAIPGIKIKKLLDDTDKGKKVVQYGEYEELDFDRIMSDTENYLACSYVYRKALIRKHFLANTIAVYTAKNPDSILRTAVPESYNLEVDYAEFLDDSLDDAYELRCELEANEEKGLKTFILKPSMSDRGQGIRLFRSIDELQAIFDSFEEDSSSDEEEDDETEISEAEKTYGESLKAPTMVEKDDDDNNGVITSQLRHFIVQQYIPNVLLLPEHENRKFHIRTYVIASGALKVHVFKEMLALFALSPYTDPSTLSVNEEDSMIPLHGHLTNTCLQGEQKDENSVHLFWQLKGLSDAAKEQIYNELCEVTGELFKAALGGGIFFQPLPNAFEIYGLDFLVTEDHHVSLLEVNAYPDFKQTGEVFKRVVIDELFNSVAHTIVAPFFGNPATESEKLKLVLEKDVSGGW